MENWFQYFPGDYKWSTNYSWLIGSIMAGGAEMSELHAVGRELRDDPTDERWYDSWLRMAESVEGAATAAAERGATVTAGDHYLRASHYYVNAQRFLRPWEDAALAAYTCSTRAFERFLATTTRVRAESVEVPFGSVTLPAYFVNAARDGERAPCAIMFGGLGLTKEMKYFRGPEELVRRGISCLVVDGPGNGGALRRDHLYWRPDYEVPAGAMLDYVRSRDDVRPDAVAAIGISAGGYSAVRAGALDPRFRAVVAWGAIWDYHEVWARRFDPTSGEVLGLPMDYMMWVLGSDSVESALDALKEYRLDGVAQRIECPVLLLHGEEDRQIPLSDAQALFASITAPGSRFITYEPSAGGQHCQSDSPIRAIRDFADWLEGVLGQGR